MSAFPQAAALLLLSVLCTASPIGCAPSAAPTGPANACSYTFDPPSGFHLSDGQSTPFVIYLTTGASCTWIAFENDSGTYVNNLKTFVQLGSGSHQECSGCSGSGKVQFDVVRNDSGGERTIHIRFSGLSPAGTPDIEYLIIQPAA